MAKATRKPPKPPTGGGSNTIPAPTGLTATMSPVGVQLQWNPVTNAQAYWVMRSDKSNAIAIITVTTFTDHYPVAGTSYKVAAVVNGVLGTFSNSVNP